MTLSDPIGPLPPRGSASYLVVELPDHFVLESLTQAGKWLDGNGYLGQDCTRREDGSYVCGHRSGGSLLNLRCVAHLEDSFIHIDGLGRPFRYRLVPVSGPNLVD